MDSAKIQDVIEKQRKFVRSRDLWSVPYRKEMLKKLESEIIRRNDDIVQAINQDLGQATFKAQFAEVDKALAEIREHLKYLHKWAKPKKVGSPLLFFPAKSYVYSEPYGHSLIIGPWNYPFHLVILPLVGSIAAGNSVIVKPSEIAANTSKVVQEIVSKALPEEVAYVVEGAVEETTFLLDQKFDHIFYTGNGVVGRIVMEKAAKHLTPVVLELGGKSPVLVHTNKVELAAKRTVFGKFFNCGQTCIAPDYVLIAEKDQEQFFASAKKWIDVFYQNAKDSQDYGRIVSDKHFQRLSSLLGDVEIKIGGDSDSQERFIEPTLVSCKPDDKIMQEEIFGPILPVVTSESLGDSIDFVLDRDKPLACYAFVDRDQEAQQVIGQISAGGIIINDTLIHISNNNLPFGGIGESGMGAYHGKFSFAAFSHQKAVMKRSYHFENSLRYPPYEKKAGLVLKLGKWLG